MICTKFGFITTTIVIITFIQLLFIFESILAMALGLSFSVRIRKQSLMV